MKQFAVIGLGKFGFSVAKTLGEKDCQVLAIDIEEEKVQDISEFAARAVQVDATDEKALRAVGIEDVDLAVVAIGAIEASILIALNLKEMGIKKIVAKASGTDHGTILERVGATRIIFPERDMGSRLANNLLAPKILDYINLSDAYSILEMVPPQGFIGKSLREIDVRAKYGLNVIGIKTLPLRGLGRSIFYPKGHRGDRGPVREGKERAGEKINFSPKADDVIREGDVFIVIGPNENIEKMKKRKEAKDESR